MLGILVYMPNYYISTRNPIARAGIIRKLMAKGYRLFNGVDVSFVFNHFPAERWRIVLARQDTPEPEIDLTYTETGIPLSFTRITLSQLNALPNLNKSNVNDKADEEMEPVVFPEAAKYSIDYVKADGKVGKYTISNPIESNKDSITAYAFGRGVRTFKMDRVRSFSRVN